MSDDLVKRLRLMGDRASFEPHMHHTAADRIEALEDEVALLREALTPSGDTKGAYMGEFSFQQTVTDENGDDVQHKTYVPWTKIKEIMSAISARAALKGDTK